MTSSNDPIKTQINKIFEENNNEPTKSREACKSYLDKLIEKRGELDPRTGENKALEACNVFNSTSLKFFELGLVSAAEQILLDGWRSFQRIQEEERQFIYKAAMSFYLSDHYQRRGDTGAAIRWALLTQAEDALNGNYYVGGQQRLQEIFGMSAIALEAFNEIARINRGKVNDDWAVPEAFSDDVVMRFILKHQKFAPLFARSANVLEFPISVPYFSGLVDRVTGSTEASEKGETLEDLASYLFLLVPGWIPRRNVKSSGNEYESDIVVSNLLPTGSLAAELFGHSFLVECKNWKEPVGTNQVGYFLYRMRLTHTRFGVIFSTEGITGKPSAGDDKSKDVTAARSLITRAFHEDGSICVVVDMKNINQLKSGETSFFSLLLDNAMTIQYGKRSQHD